MKLHKISLAVLVGLGTLASCDSKLDVSNPNQQTTATFGNDVESLEENVIAAYNHIRMEGTYARVGYTLDVCRGDEVWNSSQVWYMPFDDLNAPFPTRLVSGHGVTGITPSTYVTTLLLVVARITQFFLRL